MSCVLRVYGKRFDVETCMKKTGIKPDSYYIKGQPRFPKSKPDGPKNKYSGLSIAASNADFDRLDLQIKETEKFLTRNYAKLKKLSKFPGIEEFRIDFGIEKRDVFGQFDYFPPSLLLVAGKLGIGLELSQYANNDKGNKKVQDLFRLKKQVSEMVRVETKTGGSKRRRD